MKRLICLISAGATLASVGCSDGAETQKKPETELEPFDFSKATLDGGCPAAKLIGKFSAEANAKFNYSAVEGKVADAVKPLSVLNEVSSDGDCQLLRRKNLFCDPGCTGNDLCADSGQCVPHPKAQNLGRVTVEGLQKTLKLDPAELGFSYIDTKVDHPVYSSDAQVVLRSEGGAYEPLALIGFGSEQLEPEDDQWLVEEGKALKIHWKSSANDSQARVNLELKIDQHGTSPLALRCDFEDDGQGEVSAKLIKELLDSGVSGFPNGSFMRRTVDSQEVADGCIEFIVGSWNSVDVRVAGHQACSRDADCKDGKTCDVPVETCR